MALASPVVSSGSLLLAEELFERGSSAFVEELLRCQGGKALRRFALRWAADKRDFAHKARIALADRAVDSGDARVLVKVLFKAAAARDDDVEVVHHLVAFDRLVRRQVVHDYRFDYRTGNYVDGWRRQIATRAARFSFSVRTRLYLQRRAFRYLKRLALRSSERFLSAALLMLSLYDDQHFPEPDSILDTRSLCLLLYGGSPELRVRPRVIDVVAPATLRELRPAPIYQMVWRSKAAFDGLVDLVTRASSAFVRGWLSAWLKAEHGERLAKLSLDELRPLLASPHGEAQLLGAELLEAVGGWERLSLESWLELAKIDNPQALTIVARLIQRHVAPERLTLGQCLELATSRVHPIAQLGLGWAIDKGLHDDDEVHAASALADAEIVAVRREGMEWLKPHLVDKPRSLLLRELLDSRHRDVRDVAIGVSGEKVYASDTRVHAAMAESPYGDVTDTLTSRLRQWHEKLDDKALHHLWATILLGVRRGSRAKRATLRVLAERAVAHPDRAADVLALVAVALRSVREPERRAALATLTRAAVLRPELRAVMRETIPEFQLDEVGV
jgi:hypothetical protein